MKDRIKKILKEEGDWDWADNISPMKRFHEWYVDSTFSKINTYWWKESKNKIIKKLDKYLTFIEYFDEAMEQLHTINNEVKSKVPTNWRESLDTMGYVIQGDMYMMVDIIDGAYNSFGDYAANEGLEITDVIKIAKEYIENYEEYN
jgi:hypothetical protein